MFEGVIINLIASVLTSHVQSFIVWKLVFQGKRFSGATF